MPDSIWQWGFSVLVPVSSRETGVLDGDLRGV